MSINDNINEATIDALKVIRRVCEVNGSGSDCRQCPLSKYNGSLSSNPYTCGIMSKRPHAWDIADKFQALL